MSANLYRPHLLVLPEDEKNANAAVGFRTRLKDPRRMVVEPVCGGWKAVLDCFETEHVKLMRTYPSRSLLLLIDFDHRVQDRTDLVRSRVPSDVAERVYLLGCRGEPEDFRPGEWGKLGDLLALKCKEGDDTEWDHPELAHNKVELERLKVRLRPVLFDPCT